MQPDEPIDNGADKACVPMVVHTEASRPHLGYRRQFMLYHLHRYRTDIPSGLMDKNKPPRIHLHDSLRSWRALFRSVAGPEGRKGKPVIGLSSVNGRLGVLEGVGVDQPETVCSSDRRYSGLYLGRLLSPALHSLNHSINSACICPGLGCPFS